MTDQAAGQSVSQPVASTEQDVVTGFESFLSGKAPQGQPAPVQGEQADEAESGESPDESEQAQAESAQQKFQVPALEGDGVEELTAEELKAQRLMHADYTRKTQQVAEQRKAIEAKALEVEQQAAAKLGALDDHLQMLARSIQTYEGEVNWTALRELDPAGYVEQREKQEARLKAFERARQQAETLRAEMIQRRQAEEAQRLVEALPSWLDPQVAKQEATQLREGVTAYGFKPEEFDTVLDHRLILLARDALAYRQLKDKAGQVKAEVAKAPPIAKPNTPRQGNPEALRTFKAIQHAKANPTVDNAAAAFDRMFK
jgi:hypothetical protein